MIVVPARPRIEQPKGIAQINYSNPIINGLVGAYIPTNQAYQQVGSPKITQNSKGNAFTGVNSGYYASPSSNTLMSNIAATGQCTIIAGFICTSATPSGGEAIYSERPNATAIIKLVINDLAGTNPRLVIRNSASAITQLVANVGANDNKFHTVAGIKNGASSHAIYVDGKLSNSDTTTVANNFPTASVPVFCNDQQASTTSYLSGGVNFVYTFSRALTSAEIASLHANPWQIFQPDTRTIFLPATAVTLSYLRPSADISTGSWTPSTGTTLYTTLDEISASDTDYIQTSTASSCEIKLAAGATPSNRDNHTIRYRVLAGSGTLTAVLKCGSTTIKSWNHTLTGSAQDISNALTNAEASAITDYTDLRVTFTSS